MTVHQGFASSFFANNRQELLKRTGLPLIVVPAAGQLQRSADTTYPFCQDRNFWYLTGLSEPDLTLVLAQNGCFIIQPGRSKVRIAFDGGGQSQGMEKQSGIDTVYPEKSGWERLSSLAKQTEEIGVVATPPGYIKHYGMYTNPARSRLARRLRARFPGHTLTSVAPHLAGMRSVKQPQELKALQKAIDITTDSITQLRQDAQKMSYEYELEARLSEQFRANGGSGHAFEPIIASGRHATTLHYIENNGVLENNNLVVCDVGAQADQYCADVTRTIAIGKPTQRHREVHQAVLEVQQFALDLLKPGVLLKEYEQQVGLEMRRQLTQLGLLAPSDGREQAWRYYPHATSHFLGLDVHDVGDYTQPLAENMVLTCEPGIYIAEEGFGVRVEDDVLITAKGNHIMSNCPREL